MYVHTFSITAWGRSMKYILLMCCLIHSLHLTSSQEGNSSFQGFLLYILTNSANDDANFLLSAIKKFKQALSQFSLAPRTFLLFFQSRNHKKGMETELMPLYNVSYQPHSQVLLSIWGDMP